MEKTISLTVNGQLKTVTTEPNRPLLEVLREDLQLTGTKYGCGEGQCGACTVLIHGKSVRSCQTSVGDVDKATILTIEGLSSDNRLQPVQEAFLEENGFQCGYCTPGMIMGVAGLLNEKPNPSESDLFSRLDKHICRCCSYPKILKAAKRAAALSGR